MVRPDLNGCPWHDVKTMLREVGLRPTRRQRMALGWILCSPRATGTLPPRCSTKKPPRPKVPVSLATIYNTLNQFTEAGLLRHVAVDGSKTYFDTNVTEHHHFFIEGENALVDIPNAEAIVGKMPAAPAGFEIARVDVVVRLKRKR